MDKSDDDDDDDDDDDGAADATADKFVSPDGAAEESAACGAATEAEDESAETIVWEGFDLGENKGMKRFSSGRKEHAITHKPSNVHGFIQAVSSDGASNLYLVFGCIILQALFCLPQPFINLHFLLS